VKLPDSLWQCFFGADCRISSRARLRSPGGERYAERLAPLIHKPGGPSARFFSDGIVR
jgi:hypothetical protein